MRAPDLPLTRDLVLVGGGHTHALILRRWAMRPLAGARLTLVNPGPTAAYSGMLPGFVAGHYDREALGIDLVRLARAAGARLILGAAEGIDLAAREVRVPGRPPVGYDLLSLDIGITSAMPDVPGFAEHAVPAKPLTPFARRWDAFRNAEGPARIAVLGAGIAGAELALAMAHGARHRAPEVTLIDAGAALRELDPRAARLMRAALDGAGIALVEQAPVARVTAAGPVLEDGREIAADLTVGAAGAQPFGWLAETGLALHDGFVSVDATLRSSDPAVFAAGDCAHLSHAPRPKAGVYAVRAAPVLFDNLRAALSGGGRRPYRPQKDYLKLVSLGQKRALAQRFGTAAEGALLWRWKDRIDRRFMRKLTDLAPMEGAAVPLTAADGVREELGGHPMCGGCGSKIAHGALGPALARLPRPRDDVERLPGDDAALLRTGGARQVVTTDHLRAMVEDPVLMTRIAAIHALGDVWAMGARPQAALASIVLPRLSADLQARTLAEVMEAAGEVFAAAGAEIVGGHSTMGAETTIGFTVTGLCEGDPVTLAGARPGDVLLLTKPVGSGTILAAEMRLQARGADVAACLDAMLVPQDRASRILGGAHAMTDVTGFGLAGHLAGICAASNVGATLDIAAVPLMAGALDLAEAGVRSTIYRDNRARLPGWPEDARAALMADPQTAGGLLAAVPAGEADTLLAALRDAGYPAARIGTITEGPPLVVPA